MLAVTGQRIEICMKAHMGLRESTREGTAECAIASTILIDNVLLSYKPTTHQTFIQC